MTKLLDRIRRARTEAMIESYGSLPDPAFEKAFDELTNPGRKVLRRLSDEDLAELIAAEPTSKQGLLAASILKDRESWRTPARWALLVSGMSFALAVAAFARTF